MDESTVKWNKDRFTEIQTNLSPYLEQCGYTSEDCYWLPMSGLSGDNIKNKVDPKTCGWYQGHTLIDILDNIKLAKKSSEGPLRIPVLDKMKDRGTVIFGKIESGTVRLGDKISVMPHSIQAMVQTIYNSKEQSVRYATPGENVRIRLAGIQDDSMINKGDVVCNRESPVPVSELIEVELNVHQLLPYKPILSKGYQFIMHLHTVAEEAQIKDLMVSWERNDKGDETQKDKPQFAMSFSRVRCRISTRLPICLEKHDAIEQMGKFTLRDEGMTIASGKILKYKPAKVVEVVQVEKKEEIKQEETKQESKDFVFDLESGEIVDKEEYQRQEKEGQMDKIEEDEEYYDEEDEGDQIV